MKMALQQKRLLKGLVKDFYEEYDLSFEEFLKLYPFLIIMTLIISRK